MEISSLAPLTFTTMDGAEREFRLTMLQQRNIANRFGAKMAELPLSAALPGMLYECLADKSISEDEFAAVLPPDEELLVGFYGKLREHFSPKTEGNEKYRPTKTQ